MAAADVHKPKLDCAQVNLTLYLNQVTPVQSAKVGKGPGSESVEDGALPKGRIIGRHETLFPSMSSFCHKLYLNKRDMLTKNNI